MHCCTMCAIMYLYYMKPIKLIALNLNDTLLNMLRSPCSAPLRGSRLVKRCIVCALLLHMLTFAYGEKLTITERSDYSKYIDGAYTGLTYREARLYLNKAASADSSVYTGEAFVLEETRKNMRAVAQKIDEIIPLHFSVPAAQVPHSTGMIFLAPDKGYPLLRNFPVIPPQRFTPQDINQWTAQSTVVVRPKADREPTRIPVYVEYRYAGTQTYNNRPVNYVKAQFSLRYRGGDALGDSELLRSEGTRLADIYLDEDNKPLFIRETIDETFFYTGEHSVRHRGFLLHFYSYPRENDKKRETPADTLDSRIAAAPHFFDIQRTERGLMLNLKELHFAGNQAVLLESEYSKLDTIAELLKTIPFKRLFVEGHTANTGHPKEEETLSLERAKTVVDQLIQRGIPASAFLYTGAGAAKPLAPNDTETGRAKNRRVEITVLE